MVSNAVQEMIVILGAMRAEAMGSNIGLEPFSSMELLELFRESVTRAGKPLVIDDPCEQRSLFAGNREHIRRIVTNIVQNATAAGATEIRLLRSCGFPKHEACTFAFVDNGKGMSLAQLRRLGLPYRGDDGSPHGEGCRVIRQLCADMGVVVYWESVEGLGTKVSLVWPREEP
jgi:signal transduction histidine kinase